jgi:hypothetical protein
MKDGNVNYTVSKRSQKEMVRRGVTLDVVNRVISNPDQIVVEYGQKKRISQ